MARNDVRLDDVKIRWPNFEGRVGTYNAEGNRNFVVELDDMMAAELTANGWNVKTKPPREDGEAALHTVSVAVSYKIRDPRIVLITVDPVDGQYKRTPLDEELCGLIDHADIETADVILHPSRWEMNGNTGIKAYLKTIYVTLHQDPLDLKYGHIPMSGAAPQLEIEASSEAEPLALEAGWSDREDFIDAEVLSEEYDE